jgi:RES domain-containing protein
VSEVVCWRLCLAHRIAHAFSGEGSARRGGRWNPRGVRLVYGAESRSLAALEVLVNIDDRSRLIGLEWVCIPAVLEDRLIERPLKFPANWRQYPHGTEAQAVGSEWVSSSRSVALRVPSAVVPGEFNYLLNPAHPDFKHVNIGNPERFSFDPRLQD